MNDSTACQISIKAKIKRDFTRSFSCIRLQNEVVVQMLNFRVRMCMRLSPYHDHSFRKKEKSNQIMEISDIESNSISMIKEENKTKN